MKTILSTWGGLYAELIAHLFPADSTVEQAAFLFARCNRSHDQVVFETIESIKLGPDDFIAQEGAYLEMTDESRAALIKRAHDLDASLVEMHSHLGPWPAMFSPTDRTGLDQTVPHMWWRLRKRPYLALVFAPTGFDALLWLDDPKKPRALDGLLAGKELFTPTNKTLRRWL